MIRYRLDDLGWYQFEWMVQAALKAELGLGVESWSSARGDYGRDAYFDGELAFPARLPADGPFVFQVKFVENANASGSRPTVALRAAVRKEVKRIRERCDSGRWETPAHYALLSNTPLTADHRLTIKRMVSEALPDTMLTCLGASDVCDILDAHPTLRRSFPQLLSLRDLDLVLEEAVSRELIEKSRAAVDASKDIVRTFVPTGAYERAWKALRSHHLAVLYGPPEMGKTAIAWMVALAQLSQGWEAFLCQSPGDFFRIYKESRSQIFVADDAFGRTEYDPASTMLWEKDLRYVIPRLDQRHWLILTSRRHLLERARQQMDLQAAAQEFPSPGAILIDAEKLTIVEKALILYRHTRAVVDDPESRSVIRENAWAIVSHSAFTPERIRRFVGERLPELVETIGIVKDEVEEEILEAIRNPTRGMERAFAALEEPYKWFLISLLEAGYWPSVDVVRAHYERHCPSKSRIAFDNIQDQLLEAFVKLADRDRQVLEWIHPSCRDLVIDELVTDEYFRQRFLRTASVDGLELAVSTEGGAGGGRNLPLMVGQNDWRLFEERCAELAKDLRPHEAADLMTSFWNAISGVEEAATKTRLIRVLQRLCRELRIAWNAGETTLDAQELRAFSMASVLLRPLPEVPALGPSWAAATSSLATELANARNYLLDPSALNEWVDLADAISKCEPRFLAQMNFPKDCEDQIELWLKIVEEELKLDFSTRGPSELREELSRRLAIATALGKLCSVAPEYAGKASKLAARLKKKARVLEKRAMDLEEPELEDDEIRPGSSDSPDVRLIFSDL